MPAPRTAPPTHPALDFDRCYAAVQARDPRFDGMFYTAVRTTGIYCRPSCPARTPAPANVSFHRTAAAAQGAGYRACKRCRPDAVPGSPDWDVAAGAAGRAMRLIADGVVDRSGVPGLAAHLGYTPRHLNRLLVAELGAGPLALARTQRAQTARILVESSGLALADVAFAAGFTSVRQFNDTMREVYGVAPSELRHGRGAPGRRAEGRDAGVLALDLRVAVRRPFAGAELLAYLAARAVPGVEEVDPAASSYARTLRLPHGPGWVRVVLADTGPSGGTSGHVAARFWLHDLRDTGPALARVRALVDADADPVAVDAHLTAAGLGDLVALRPGLRVPGHVDGAELAVRAVLGQQVSIAAARTLTARLVRELGEPVVPPLAGLGGLDRLFPSPGRIASLDPAGLAMPQARARALLSLASAVDDATLVLDRGPDRGETRRRLLAQPGIGPWTAGYVAMRALGDPDVWLESDAALRRALAVQDRGGPADPRRLAPWRSYALQHLWASLPAPPAPTPSSPARPTKETAPCGP
ncbi:Ada metal-binding domain-containing protein [Nocardioides sp.]|uniref:Ada metal-binding domain-containing protein n=1 Tax=Nocardioides sp. TaxID=35761 RepID=UPI0035136FDA